MDWSRKTATSARRKARATALARAGVGEDAPPHAPDLRDRVADRARIRRSQAVLAVSPGVLDGQQVSEVVRLALSRCPWATLRFLSPASRGRALRNALGRRRTSKGLVRVKVVGGSGPNTQSWSGWVSRLRRPAWGYRVSPWAETTTVTSTLFPRRSNLNPPVSGMGVVVSPVGASTDDLGHFPGRWIPCGLHSAPKSGVTGAARRQLDNRRAGDLELFAVASCRGADGVDFPGEDFTAVRAHVGHGSSLRRGRQLAPNCRHARMAEAPKSPAPPPGRDGAPEPHRARRHSSPKLAGGPCGHFASPSPGQREIKSPAKPHAPHGSLV